MTDNRELVGILEAELRRLNREVGEGPFLTLEEKAERLGVDKGYYSKLQRGKRVLTRRKAHEIASKLRKGRARAAELEERLIAAGEGSSESLKGISDWFKERVAEKSLLIVEFRDFGIVRQGRMSSNEARMVAESIYDGLSYGMFRPFADVNEYGKEVPEPLHRFLSLLQQSLYDTYETLLRTLLEHARDRVGNTADARDRILEAERRLKLYCLRPPSSLTCGGVGYRLFYTEQPSERSHEQASTTGTVSHDQSGASVGENMSELPPGQLWDWFTFGGKHHLTPKVSNSKSEADATVQATAIRFFPIVEYWRENRYSLPQTDTEMTNFTNKFKESSLYVKRHGLDGQPLHWSVVTPPRALIDEYLPQSAARNAGKTAS